MQPPTAVIVLALLLSPVLLPSTSCAESPPESEISHDQFEICSLNTDGSQNCESDRAQNQPVESRATWEAEAAKVQIIDISDKIQKIDAGRTPEEPFSVTDDENDKRKMKVEHGGLLVTGPECVDDYDHCEALIKSNGGNCDGEGNGRDWCKASCGVCKRTEPSKKRMTIGVQQLKEGSPSENEAIQEVLNEMVRYLREEVLIEKGYEEMYEDCINRHELCAFWAAMDQCAVNPGYMERDCMLACKKCDRHSDYLHTMVFGRPP